MVRCRSGTGRPDAQGARGLTPVPVLLRSAAEVILYSPIRYCSISSLVPPSHCVDLAVGLRRAGLAKEKSVQLDDPPAIRSQSPVCFESKR